MEDGVFRSKKGFTVVQNIIAKNDGLSLKAKGLYLVIQANITMPNKQWKKTDFMNMTKEGRKAFDSAWNELKEFGFLKIYKRSTQSGFISMYELLDEPIEGPHTFFYNPFGKLLSTNVGAVADGEYSYFANVFESDECQQTQQNSLMSQKGTLGNETLVSQKGALGKGAIGKGTLGKGTLQKGDCNNLNTIKLNTNGSKDSSHQILSKESERDDFVDNFLSDDSMTCVRGEDEMGMDYNITLDITDSMYDDSIHEYRDILEENGGVPIEYAFEPEKMKIALLAVCGWDYVANDIRTKTIYPGSLSSDEEIYVTMVSNLIEMAINKTTLIGGTRTITYKHVNDKINQIYHKSEHKTQPLYGYMEQCVNRYKEATIKTKIIKIDAYCKSILWNSFDTFKMDWNGYFNRTFYGNFDE